MEDLFHILNPECPADPPKKSPKDIWYYIETMSYTSGMIKD